MPLSNFSITQANNTTEKIALTENYEHKLQLQKIQLENFFITHKDEEW